MRVSMVKRLRCHILAFAAKLVAVRAVAGALDRKFKQLGFTPAIR